MVFNDDVFTRVYYNTDHLNGSSPVQLHSGAYHVTVPSLLTHSLVFLVQIVFGAATCARHVPDSWCETGLTGDTTKGVQTDHTGARKLVVVVGEKIVCLVT